MTGFIAITFDKDNLLDSFVIVDTYEEAKQELADKGFWYETMTNKFFQGGYHTSESNVMVQDIEVIFRKKDISYGKIISIDDKRNSLKVMINDLVK
jgi:hypothetical protein